MNRRAFLGALSATLATAASQLPANRNVRWALSLGLWSHYPPCPFTGILDLMKDTGFIGIRLTGYPGCLLSYHLTAAEMEREVSKRGLSVVTISFGGPVNDESMHPQVVGKAREAMRFLQGFGAKHLVVFPPGIRNYDIAAFRAMCRGFNRIGEAAGAMGFRAGVHNHLGGMVERPEEVHRCMEWTDAKVFHFAPDTAHLHLGGSNVVEMLSQYKRRLIFLDYKDARWTTPKAAVRLPNGSVYPRDSVEARFFESIYDLGDGEIDFSACHRVLKEIDYTGWICVDLDRTRNGPRASYDRCGAYIVSRLEPIYL